MKTAISVVFPALIVAGCSTNFFTPELDQEVETKVASAFEDVSYIAACISLGSCASSAQYNTVTNNYVNAVSSLDTAGSLVQTKINPGASDERAATILRDEILECRNQVVEMSKAHKKFPTLANSTLPQTTKQICLIALTGVKSL